MPRKSTKTVHGLRERREKRRMEAAEMFATGRTRAEVAEATAGARALTERLADLDSAIDVEVRQRRLEVESARAAVQAARA